MLGLSAVIPVLHGVEMYGVEDMQGRIGLYWLLLQGFLYILGAGLYAVSWTERTSLSFSLTVIDSLARTVVTWLI